MKLSHDKSKTIRLNLGQVGRNILMVLLDMGDGFLDGIYDVIAHPHMNFSKYNGSYASFYKSTRNLNKHGLVRLSEKQGKLSAKLTKQGYELANRLLILELPINRIKKWDGMWRVVIFDIPETHKIVREVLREKLKFLGFMQIQKSVFVIPWPCKEAIRTLQNFYQSDKFIKYMEVFSFDGEGLVKKHFGLFGL